MRLYAESSAVLAWLLGEADGALIRPALASAEIVLTSRLTIVECQRVLVRLSTLHELREAEAAERAARLVDVARYWVRFDISDRIWMRAAQPFPHEPIRTLDALHLATALEAKAAVGDVRLLSLDERVRRAGRGLGFVLEPAE